MSWIPSYKKPGGGSSSYVPCDWSTGTDAEIVEAVEQHYLGNCDLTEYWSVGDERVITMSASYVDSDKNGTVYRGDTQDITWVLTNVGGRDLTTPINGHTECAFVVSMKELFANLATISYGGTSNTGWNTYRTSANRIYNTLPSTIAPIFKQFQNVYQNASEQLAYCDDYFSYFCDYELNGSTSEQASPYLKYVTTYYEYYQTSANRKKTNYFFKLSNNWYDYYNNYFLRDTQYSSSGYLIYENYNGVRKLDSSVSGSFCYFGVI